jgi:TRAP-type C4-dicarboxylate transport system permease small subunit
MELLDRISKLLTTILTGIAGCALVCMTALICCNIAMRLVFNTPITGTYELMGLCGALVTALSLGYTQLQRKHISVVILTNTFPPQWQHAATVVSDLVCMIFFGAIAWQISKWSTTLLRTGEVTETLRIIYYPFTYAVALGCAVLALILLTDTLKVFFPGKMNSR